MLIAAIDPQAEAGWTAATVAREATAPGRTELGGYPVDETIRRVGQLG